MKIDTIKTELKQLDTAVEELKKILSDLYGDELPQEPTELSKGLRFKTDTDLFTEEEIKTSEILENTIVSSLRLERTLSEELSNITRAQHDRESYYSSLYSGADLVTLYKETDETLQQAQTLSQTLGILSRGIQNIACSRYFDRLEHKGKSRNTDKMRAILAEIKAIGSGAEEKTADGETVKVGGFAVIDNRGDSFTEKLSQIFENIQAVNLLCYYSNSYYELNYRAILPTHYKDITTDKQKAFIRETIEPCFKSHIEAIRALHLPVKEAENLINNAVETIYNQLDIVIEAGAEIGEGELLHAKRNPVKDFSISTSLANREVFRTPHTDSFKSKQITIYDYLDEKTAEKKTVSTYLSVSYNELEGVAVTFTPEQETTYNAIDSEFQAGNSLVTTRQIYKTMLGGDSSAKLSDSKREELTELIDNLAKTRTTIDNSEHAKKTGRKKFVRVTDNLLNITHLEEAEIDGKVLRDVWLIKERPILSRYADSIGQTRNIPMKLIQTGTGVNYTALRDHLLTQILYMKNDRQKRSNRTILLAPVYTDLYNAERTETKQGITKNAETMLQHWIREGFIYSYELELSDRTQREIAKAESKGKSTQKIKKVATAIIIYLSNNKLTTEAQLNRHLATEKRGRKKM